ncbi:MAG: hypothetical protein ACJA1R_002343, partial [Flavobacteriales bacterium]
TNAVPSPVRRVPLPICITAWVMLGLAATYGVWLYGAHRASVGQSLSAAPWVCIVALIALTIVWELFSLARKKAKAAQRQGVQNSAPDGGDVGDDAKKKPQQPDLDKHPNATRGGLQTGTRLWMRLAFLMAAISGCALYNNAGTLADGAAAHGDWFIAQSDEAPSGIRYTAAVGATEVTQLLRRLEPETATQRWIRELEPTLSVAQLAVDERAQQDGDTARPTNTWPHRTGGHTAASTVTIEQEQTPRTLGQHFHENTTGGYDTAHAIHCWMSTQITFDLEAHQSGEVPAQDPTSVLARRSAIGAGFAALFVAVGEAAGLDVRYISGVARDHAGEVVGRPHAWNAIGLDDGWMLVDAARDARDLENERLLRQGEAVTPDERIAQYNNDEDLRLGAYAPFYLGAPSDMFGVSHYPDDARWQLAFPQWRLPFTQQPLMRPEFYARGLSFDEGTRSQSEGSRDIVFEIENPQLFRMRADITALDDGYQVGCTARGRHLMTVRCTAERPGLHRVDLETAAGQLRDGDFVGALQVWVH